MLNYTFSPIVTRLFGLDILYPLLQDRAYIAGSFAVACMQERISFDPTDIDVFVLPNQMGSLIRDLEPVVGEFDNKWSNIYRSVGKVDERHIQLIDRGYETPQEIITSFDWSCCSAAIVGKDTVLAHEDILNSKGSVLRISNLAKSFGRMLKYSRRGFHFDDDQYQLITELAKNYADNMDEYERYDWGRYIYESPLLQATHIHVAPDNDTIPF